MDVRDGSTTAWETLPAVTLERPTVAAVASSVDALPYVAAVARSGGELLVVAERRVDDALRTELLSDGFRLVGALDGAPDSGTRAAEDGRIWLLTSGSTGRPKRVAHTLASLTTVKGAQATPRRWLCPYSPGTYAWWQVVTLGLTQPGHDLVVVDPSDLEHWVPLALDHEVTAASGTPTFWRQSVLRDPETLARVPLQQISLGGEPVDQAVIDQLRELFPEARISWIYASSEVGASIVVHDGLAGFPQAWLGRASVDRPLIEVDGDELVITSPHHGRGLDGPVRTGDRVRVEDGRVYITGRLDRDEINVGGSKVSAGHVRDTLQSHPSVVWASVRGRRAPLVGSVVVADVVLRDDTPTAELTGWASERLPEYAVPRRLKVLDTIPTKETLKSDA
ncbi:acyl--CoA ligase [Mumia sp. zg.B21]|nr:acyl--CoA ligase [Mumia sp. zg.B21]